MITLFKYALDELIAKTNKSDLSSKEKDFITVVKEEIVFCKNNVCVHGPPSAENSFEETHYPGYLCLKNLFRKGLNIPEIHITWIPNTLLKVAQEMKETNGCGAVATATTSSPHNLKSDIGEGLTSEECMPDITSQTNACKPFETPYGDIFSVNLSDLKTLKLFAADRNGCGQFVICNNENQYKVFHFHFGGLKKLRYILRKWQGSTISSVVDNDGARQIVYSVNDYTRYPSKALTSLFSEDGRYRALDNKSWKHLRNQHGQIEDVNGFRKHIFFGGVSGSLRSEIWKFLLHLFPVQSTMVQREKLIEEKQQQYKIIHNQRLALKGEAYQKFWKAVQFTVDKDVIRTDRSNPYFAGDDNPNVQKMRNILLNYAVYNPSAGYTQGMSDLLAPLLCVMQDESDSFWCFAGLMGFSMFATKPTDESMDRSLAYLRGVMELLLPDYYAHFTVKDPELNLIFCHRWLVLCFKREFVETEVLNIWEACWSRYKTNWFHIFVAAAVINLYGDKCLEKKLNEDEMLLHFSNMAQKYDGTLVLIEARDLLYKFRQLQTIPCNLRGLINLEDAWDGGILPTFQCTNDCDCEKGQNYDNIVPVDTSVEFTVSDSNVSMTANDDVSSCEEVIEKLDETRDEAISVEDSQGTTISQGDCGNHPQETPSLAVCTDTNVEGEQSVESFTKANTIECNLKDNCENKNLQSKQDEGIHEEKGHMGNENVELKNTCSDDKDTVEGSQQVGYNEEIKSHEHDSTKMIVNESQPTNENEEIKSHDLARKISDDGDTFHDAIDTSEHLTN